MLEQNTKWRRAEDAKENSDTLSFIILVASCASDTFSCIKKITRQYVLLVVLSVGRVKHYYESYLPFRRRFKSVFNSNTCFASFKPFSVGLSLPYGREAFKKTMNLRPVCRGQ